MSIPNLDRLADGRRATAPRARHPGATFPAVVQFVEEAQSEIRTFYDFPVEHRRQLYSANPLERVNKEVEPRTNLIGIFPNERAVIRLVGSDFARRQDRGRLATQSPLTPGDNSHRPPLGSGAFVV